MSIKTSIFLFLLMVGFSFNAFSAVGDIYESTGVYKDKFKSCLKPGTRYSEGPTSVCSEVLYHGESVVFIGYVPPFSGHTAKTSTGYQITGVVSAILVGSCREDEVLIDGECVAEPICELPSQLDPDTLECVTLSFCDRESTNESLFDAEQSCAAEGGIFSYQCSDFLESLDTRCTQSDKCAIGFSGWPDCIQDLDPTDDITPPSGGFNPGSGPTANPDGPTFDKPEPDEVTSTDTTDEAVLEAIQNANRDSNEGFKALSTDLNNGFTDINNSLSNLNATNTAIGESVVEQMNQDYEIYQANKDLALQQTGAITAGASSITDALGAQTGDLTGALGEQTGALTDAIGELASKLPEQCIPDATNNFCENPHGLDDSYIGDLFYQMDSATNDTIDDSHGLIEGFIQDVIDSPLNDENESIMNNSTNVLLNALGYNDACSPLSFEANGNTYSIDCYVSEKIKLILSFLIGIYTLMTLTDILLDGITPIGRKPSATRYA
ncbi:hypothetical protein AB4268_03000 [Vibrio cyclitrophicus]|uniref:hypothetical protein n=1 Tax=Vibrio cyclitrophicus TaxID=47951 RepID=UPI000C830BF7|nr:hypothetical protein [Vibrio cyclitrophicus]PMK23783.1 hypothetical protein BCU04_13570 [Vibrio cyclitrophicus]